MVQATVCSFVIVSYQCKEELLECVNSIRRHDESLSEILVVDNASSDGTREILQSRSDIQSIFCEKNLGFSSACNIGLSAARSPVVCFLNPDTILPDNQWLNAARVAVESHVIFSPIILNSNHQPQTNLVSFPSAMEIWKEALYMHLLFRRKNFESSPAALSGCCMMGKKSLFIQLNGFDENLFWCEDIDLCFRARQKNIELRFFPQWQIIHLGSKSASKNLSVSIPNQIISKFRFMKKHKKYAGFFLSVPAAYLHIVSRLIIFGICAWLYSPCFHKTRAYWMALKKFTEFLLQGKTNLT